MHQKTLVEKLTTWIGSLQSLVVHTLVFACSFIFALTGVVSWSFMLLVLTTVLSLEAIYLAIFIQMTVNRHSEDLAEVTEDVEDIQENIEEISSDVENIQEDVEEIQENVDEIQEDVEEISVEEATEEGPDPIEQLTRDVQRVLADLEHLKKK
jgi:uncharacterized protein YlxW (UPF0749 family)